MIHLSAQVNLTKRQQMNAPYTFRVGFHLIGGTLECVFEGGNVVHRLVVPTTERNGWVTRVDAHRGETVRRLFQEHVSDTIPHHSPGLIVETVLASDGSMAQVYPDRVKVGHENVSVSNTDRGGPLIHKRLYTGNVLCWKRLGISGINFQGPIILRLAQRLVEHLRGQPQNNPTGHTVYRTYRVYQAMCHMHSPSVLHHGEDLDEWV